MEDKPNESGKERLSTRPFITAGSEEAWRGIEPAASSSNREAQAMDLLRIMKRYLANPDICPESHEMLQLAHDLVARDLEEATPQEPTAPPTASDIGSFITTPSWNALEPKTRANWETAVKEKGLDNLESARLMTGALAHIIDSMDDTEAVQSMKQKQKAQFESLGNATLRDQLINALGEDNPQARVLELAFEFIQRQKQIISDRQWLAEFRRIERKIECPSSSSSESDPEALHTRAEELTEEPDNTI